MGSSRSDLTVRYLSYMHPLSKSLVAAMEYSKRTMK